MSIDIDPNIWGKSFWYTLHTLSFTYPEHQTTPLKI